MATPRPDQQPDPAEAPAPAAPGHDYGIRLSVYQVAADGTRTEPVETAVVELNTATVGLHPQDTRWPPCKCGKPGH